jgi:WD40 repeat protein
LFQRLLIMGLVALLVLALFIGFHAPAPSSSRQYLVPIPTSVAFSIVDERNDLDCLRAAAWRPDGRFLAVLGSTYDCPVTSYEPGIINIYNADGATLLRQLRPDRWIFAQLHLEVPSVTGATPTVAGKPNSGYAAPIVYYHSILWSPNLLSLGVTFTVITSFAPLQQFAGLLTVAATGSHQQVFLQPVPPSDLYGSLYLVWSIAAGRPVVMRNVPLGAQMPADAPVNITPALLYSWQESGVLVPEPGTQLTSKVGLPQTVSLIGNPDGGRTFTPWQPGTLIALGQANQGQAMPVDIYTWSSTFSAWSPDGQYLIDTIAFAARLQPPELPVPSSQILMRQQEEALPLAPIRDRALQQVLTEMFQTHPGTSSSASLAWRGDGRILAVFGIDGINIDFFDSATGRHLASLQNPGSTYAIDNGILGWSPDGNWLLLSSGEIMSVRKI